MLKRQLGEERKQLCNFRLLARTPPFQGEGTGSIPVSCSNSMRVWYIGCAPAFQAVEASSSLATRSTQLVK